MCFVGLVPPKSRTACSCVARCRRPGGDVRVSAPRRDARVLHFRSQLAFDGEPDPMEVAMPDLPVVMKIADDADHETFQINDERYLSSVKVPEREQDQAYIATESWITFDEQGLRAELAQAFGASGPEIETLLQTARKEFIDSARRPKSRG